MNVARATAAATVVNADAGRGRRGRRTIPHGKLADGRLRHWADRVRWGNASLLGLTLRSCCVARACHGNMVRPSLVTTCDQALQGPKSRGEQSEPRRSASTGPGPKPDRRGALQFGFGRAWFRGSGREASESVGWLAPGRAAEQQGGPVYFHRYHHYRGGFGWLRRRALITGTPYWWHRYRACRYGW